MRSLSLAPALLLLCAAAAGHEAHDHGDDEAAAEASAVTLFAGAGWRYLSTTGAYPPPQLPGVLEAGSPRGDAVGGGLDYAEAGAHLRLATGQAIQWEGEVDLTHHGDSSSDVELEAAWLAASGELLGHDLSARGGRQPVPLGLENQTHSHGRDFGIAPLALRATINDDWSADGLRGDVALGWGFSAGAGVWQNRGFPGTPDNGANLTTWRLGWANRDWRLEGGYATTAAAGRALLTTGLGGHTHNVPTCSGAVTTATVVCLWGDVDLWSTAARWQPAGARWWLGGEYWRKVEEGRLDSFFGAPDYRGTSDGGWLDAGYEITPEVTAIGRVERLVASHRLDGTNAALVATQAGIADSDGALDSAGLVLAWRPRPGHRITAEWHHDRSGTAPEQVFLLRYQMELEKGVF